MKQTLLAPNEVTNDKIFNILFTQDELTWQNIIYDMIDAGEIEPWDVDVGKLAKKFIQKVRSLKEMDFRISGKVVLAAAILLKIKSNKLLHEDIVALDQLINSEEDDLDLLEDIEDLDLLQNIKKQRPKIYPRTPQPRKRKVSVYDLVNALEKALETEDKRKKRWTVPAPRVEAPKKGKEITAVIGEVYGNIVTHFKKNAETKLTFTNLSPSDSKEDKVMTFIPLLHLETQRKVDMHQPKHFGEIFVKLTKKKAS
ncbi:MAG: segregation/condensation protein A [Nanoarchaeota archaeon]|nr:segregation/condensation protein A [Nanoarchaeota archaeon]